MRKKIEVITARLHKLDPNKAYLIQVDETLAPIELDLLSAKLKEFGLKNAVVVAGPVKVHEVKDNASN